MDARQETYEPVLTNYKASTRVDWAAFLRQENDDADTALPMSESSASPSHHDAAGDVKAHHAGRKGDRRSPDDGPRRSEASIGHGRAHGVCFAGAEWLLRATAGEGDSGRGHVHAPPCSAARQKPRKWDTGHLYAARATLQTPGTVHSDAIRSSREAVMASRVRLRESRAEHVVIWDSAVRRFRQRCAGRIDQYASGGSEVGGRANGITLMLPHGYKAGPGALVARLERFMQLEADNNMRSCSRVRRARSPRAAPADGGMFRKSADHHVTRSRCCRAKERDPPLAGSRRAGVPHCRRGQRRRSECRRSQARDRVLGQGISRLVSATPSARTPTSHCVSRSSIRYRPKAFAAEIRKYPNVTRCVVPGRAAGNRAPGSRAHLHPRETWFDGQKLGYAGRPESASPAVGLRAPAPGTTEEPASNRRSASSRASDDQVTTP